MKKNGNKIVISPLAKAKIDNWVDLCKYEISGFGYVDVLSDGTIYVDDVFILRQEVSSGDTEIDSEAISLFLSTLDDQSYDRVRFWWHSHVNMDVFWSSTDEAGIDQLRGDKFFLHGVFNKKGKSKIRLEVAEPYWQHTFDDLKHEVKDLSGQADGMFNRMIEDFMKSDDFNIEEDPVSTFKNFLHKNKSFDPYKAMKESTREYCKSEMDEKVTPVIPTMGRGVYGWNMPSTYGYSTKGPNRTKGGYKKKKSKTRRYNQHDDYVQMPLIVGNATEQDDEGFASLYELMKKYEQGDIEYE